MKPSVNISPWWCRSMWRGIRSVNLLLLFLSSVIIVHQCIVAKSMQVEGFTILGNNTNESVVLKVDGGSEYTIYPGQTIRLTSIMRNQRVIILLHQTNGDWTRHELWTDNVYAITSSAPNSRFEVVMEGRIKN
jgi:hypothetical protein